jgi:hypothetical protein
MNGGNNIESMVLSYSSGSTRCYEFIIHFHVRVHCPDNEDRAAKNKISGLRSMCWSDKGSRQRNMTASAELIPCQCHEPTHWPTMSRNFSFCRKGLCILSETTPHKNILTREGNKTQDFETRSTTVGQPPQRQTRLSLVEVLRGFFLFWNLGAWN